MNFFKKIYFAIGKFISGTIQVIKPEIHNHYENNFDLAKLDKKVDDLVRENQDLKTDKTDLICKLSDALKRNSELDNVIDNYRTIFEIMLTYINDKQARNRIKGILKNSRENVDTKKGV